MSTSKEKFYTIEEVDKLLLQAPKSRAVATVPAHLKKMSATQLVNILVKICGVVNQAIPVLKFARSFLFFKPKWQKAIDNVIEEVAKVCIVPE